MASSAYGSTPAGPSLRGSRNHSTLDTRVRVAVGVGASARQGAGLDRPCGMAGLLAQGELGFCRLFVEWVDPGPCLNGGRGLLGKFFSIEPD
jgi:hypothetical protein